MLKKLRQLLIERIWDMYCQTSPHIIPIIEGLKQKNIQFIPLDHFAIIDLPGPHSGIPVLNKLFSALGYAEQGKGYLASKQNDFLWLAEEDNAHQPAKEVLPQVVVADFRLDEMPIEIRKIIEKYAHQTKPSPLHQIKNQLEEVMLGHHDVITTVNNLIFSYLGGRDWPLPTLHEFLTVQAFNELLAWVLIFGRRPNHFTLSIHLLSHFKSLEEFHHFIEHELQLTLNLEGGIIKGGEKIGIAQSSTIDIPQTIHLMDGQIEIPTGFVEFVWRYPHDAACRKPLLWNDFFTGFIPQHANHVIESLYVNENKL